MKPKFKEDYLVMNNEELLRKVTFVGSIQQLNSLASNYYFSGNKEFVNSLTSENSISEVPLLDPKSEILVAKSLKGIVSFVNERQLEKLIERFTFYVGMQDFIAWVWSVRTFFVPSVFSWKSTTFYMSVARNKKFAWLRLVIFLFNSIIKTIIKPFVLLFAFFVNMLVVPFSSFGAYMAASLEVSRLSRRKAKEYIFNLSTINDQMEKANIELARTRNEFFSTGTNLFTFLVAVSALVVSIIALFKP